MIRRTFVPRLVLLTFSMLAVLFVATAAAQDGTTSPGFFSDLTVAQVATLIGIFTPLVVGVIVKSTASKFVFGVVGTLAVAVNAAVALLVGENAPDTVTLGVLLSVILPAVAAHVGSYRIAWKPTGIAPVVNGATDALPLQIG